MKRAYVLMTPIFIADLCKWRTISSKTDGSDIPKDAKFITAEYLDSRLAFKVIFEHDSFKEIPEGAEIPRMNPPNFTYYHGPKPDEIEKLLKEKNANR